MDLEEKRKKRLASEYGEAWKPVRGALGVALVYPNTYRVGMSNLGFQSIYHLLNQRDDVSCERVFLPDREEREKGGNDKSRYRSLESGRLLNAFDLLAFSVSFELDYIHIIEILRAGRVPPFRQDRTPGKDPMVWIGGVGVSINPEPLADLADLIVVGEAEELLPEVMDGLARFPVRDRRGLERFTDEIRALRGIYLPHEYAYDYNENGPVKKITHRPEAPSQVKRRWVKDLDRFPAVSRVLTPDTELNDMYLVELDRGCGRHCRFCAAGYLYRPPRFRQLEKVLASVREGLAYTDRIGFVGTAVSDYPWMAQLVQKVGGLGARMSVSSLRADSVSPDLMSALAESGHKTVSLAPEGGSQRMRDVINKGLNEQEILDACGLAFSSSIQNLKLYFIVGLPYEVERDIEAIVELVRRIKELQLQEGKKKGRIGRLTVSLNCFVPKPHTPFQWFPMNKKDALSKKIGYIRERLRKEGNIKVIHDLPKWAIIQSLLSRGDRRIGALLCSVAEKGGNWTQALKETGRGVMDSAFRVREKDEIFPWDVVASGCRREYLYQEFTRSASGKFTHPCPEDLKCKRCGLCEEAKELKEDE